MAARFVPTEEQKRYVHTMTAMGIPQENIARIMQINVLTVAKAFRHEIAIATDEANAKVAGSLFKQATEEGNVAAAIFWLKTRARWKEPKTEVDITHSDISAVLERINAEIRDSPRLRVVK